MTSQMMFDVVHDFLFESFRRLEPRLESNKGFDNFSPKNVRFANYSGFGTGGIADNGALDLEWANSLALGLDDIVSSANKPIITIFILESSVTGNIVTLDEVGFEFFWSHPNLDHLGGKPFF